MKPTTKYKIEVVNLVAKKAMSKVSHLSTGILVMTQRMNSLSPKGKQRMKSAIELERVKITAIQSILS